MAFHIGQKVTMKRPFQHRRDFGEIGPVFGEVYTIRDIVQWGYPCLLLLEVVNAPQRYIDGFCEGGFAAHKFRPVKTTSTQVALLKRLLLPTKMTEPA